MNMNKIPLAVLLSWKLFFFNVADEDETCVQSSIPVLYQDFTAAYIDKMLSSLQKVCIKYEPSSTKNLRKHNHY